MGVVTSPWMTVGEEVEKAAVTGGACWGKRLIMAARREEKNQIIFWMFEVTKDNCIHKVTSGRSGQMMMKVSTPHIKRFQL